MTISPRLTSALLALLLAVTLTACSNASDDAHLRALAATHAPPVTVAGATARTSTAPPPTPPPFTPTPAPVEVTPSQWPLGGPPTGAYARVVTQTTTLCDPAFEVQPCVDGDQACMRRERAKAALIRKLNQLGGQQP